MGMWISPGKDGRIIRDRQFARGERIPVVVVVGADPLLFLAAAAPIPHGMDEFAWAGGVRGEAIEVVRGRHTGLPFPATAEIAIEGWIDPEERHPEGPYGEFHGYFYKGVWDARYDQNMSPPFYPGYVVDSGGPTGAPTVQAQTNHPMVLSYKRLYYGSVKAGEDVRR